MARSVNLISICEAGAYTVHTMYMYNVHSTCTLQDTRYITRRSNPTTEPLLSLSKIHQPMLTAETLVEFLLHQKLIVHFSRYKLGTYVIRYSGYYEH